MTAEGKSGIYIEFVPKGNVVKVTAIDARTGTEASIVGPSNAPRGALEAAAARKLEYVLKKNRGSP
ncbi:MAG TPA: hypothetical protein VHW02_15330 [Rhizomicrobium sp.]|jgi:hypothetical protein|nr:hypothetical protein [Rhizomicrobium sp.]